MIGTTLHAALASVVRLGRADPPLDPTPEEGRRLMRRELLRPEYNQESGIRKLVEWIRDRLLSGADRLADSPPLTTFVSLLVLALLVVALVWLVSRVRGAARSRVERGVVLDEAGVTAAELRARAEAALADGRADDALVDAYRALALRQIERGAVEDVPGATAHELAEALGSRFEPVAGRLREAGRLFDLVHYGHRSVGAAEALAVLSLDDELAGVR